MQGDTFSWLGYPDDTIPSSRNFLPGLSSTAQHSSTLQQEQEQEQEQEGEARLPFSLALGSVAVRNGRIALQVHGEACPRWLEHINGRVLLADNYRC